jgi:hypothetical protein
MASDEIEILVSNPSSESRTDYVEARGIELGSLAQVEKDEIELIEIVDGEERSVDFQIDSLDIHDRDVLVFLAKEVPPAGTDDYNKHSAKFVLRRRKGGAEDPPKVRLRPYECKQGEIQETGWDSKNLAGVELGNDLLTVWLSLGGPPSGHEARYAGAVTSVKFQNGKEFLEPLRSGLRWEGHNEEKQCMRIERLSFLREGEPSMEVNFLPKSYDLIYHNVGPVRGVVVLRSGPFGLVYRDPSDKSLVDRNCFLYRTIAIYPGRPYLIEDLYVEAKQHREVTYPEFVASYYAWIGLGTPPIIKQYELIPDWFALCSDYPPKYYGYGFAADVHIAGKVWYAEANKFRWQLEPSSMVRCLHLFMHEYSGLFEPKPRFDDRIGHRWYESLFKPLRVICPDPEGKYRPVAGKAVNA